LEVIYKLLEGSWEDDAVQNNPETGVFTDPAKVHNIDHDGQFFRVPGAAVTEPSSQLTPVIYQAGASTRGRAFSAKHAVATFVNSPTPALLAKSVDRKGTRLNSSHVSTSYAVYCLKKNK